MAGPGPLNLSLLSRGIGEVQKNGQEKVEVFLEPSDYLNLAPETRFFLPPLQRDYGVLDHSKAVPRYSERVPLPKTFTTRKGALLLFSEDLAMKAQQQQQSLGRGRTKGQHVGEDVTDPGSVLKTVDDLAKSVLLYGARDSEEKRNQVYLKFLHRRLQHWPREIRPGYSAHRYLSTWTRTWDDAVFDNVVSKGFLTERSVFHYSLMVPHSRRSLLHDDLSAMPQPYRLMRAMLITPGSLSGYTFYTVPGAAAGRLTMDRGAGALDDGQRPDTMRSIRVVRTTQTGAHKEVRYAALDRDAQQEVITDLLVKSAVHYALSQQEELMEHSMNLARESGEEGGPHPPGSPTKTPTRPSVKNFDMREAVDSLLDSTRGGPYTVGGQRADLNALNLHEVHRIPEESGGDTGASGSVRDASASSSASSLRHLPGLGRPPLSPIRDVSRETSQVVALPPIHAGAGAEVAGHVTSDDSSPHDPALYHQHPARRPRQRVARSLIGSSLDSKSMKGSMIMAPDGEIISVGGSVGPPANHDVAILSDVTAHKHHYDADESATSENETEEWKAATKRKTPLSVRSKASHSSAESAGKRVSMGGASGVTEQDVLDTLTQHAQRIALSVLSQPRSGQHLQDDVREAVEEIMKAQRASSAGPTSAEYEDLIRRSLTIAAARAAGLDPSEIPEDAELSPELLEALSNNTLSPQDITLSRDPATGRPLLQPRSRLSDAPGGVAPGHIYVSPSRKGSHSGSETGSVKRHMSIPADRSSQVDDLDYDVINYGAPPPESHRSQSSGHSKAGSAGAEAALESRSGPIDSQQADDVVSGQAAATPSADLGAEVKEGEATDQKDPAQLLSTQKSQPSDDTKTKKKTSSPEEPFIVGMPKQRDDLSLLYGGQTPSTKSPDFKPAAKIPGKKKEEKGKAKKGKGKKGKKKKEEEAEESEASQSGTTDEAAAPATEIPSKEAEPVKPREPSPAEPPMEPSPRPQSEDMEFHIVREKTSPPPFIPHEPPFPDDDLDEEDEVDDDGEEDRLKSISNREARAAKRNAAAAKRREEVERRRREREEQQKREKEDQERQEMLRREMEEDRKKREEERRARKQQAVDEMDRLERQRQEREKKEQMLEERERRAKEEYQRKLEELRRQQMEEDERRMELQRQREKEEEERRIQEELMLAQMAEEEREEYLRKKKEEEEERKRREEEARLRREEEARQALLEAQRLAEEIARKQAELEARLRFNRGLQVEAGGLDHSHDINRAFVFSYFELLQWLGLDIPDSELAKLGQLGH